MSKTPQRKTAEEIAKWCFENGCNHADDGPCDYCLGENIKDAFNDTLASERSFYLRELEKLRIVLRFADEVLGDEESNGQIRLEAAGYTREALAHLNKLIEEGA